MRRICIVLLALALAPLGALAAEGDPLLSVDDLLALEDSYTAFLTELESLIVSRGLLSEDEREAWRDAQMGDYFQNGGYGSMLINYTPGVLGYVREEETRLQLRLPLGGGCTLHLDTMRRYTPEDSSLSGLMLTLGVTDAEGAPMDAAFALSGTSGIFLKWDAMAGAYAGVGATAQSDGETVVWSDQAPLVDAKNPVITLAMTDVQTGQPLGTATLTLTVDSSSYRVGEDALALAP
ncbi:MAG: hypothetical protein ACI4PG_12850 [Candidatus Ventricola sp.]